MSFCARGRGRRAFNERPYGDAALRSGVTAQQNYKLRRGEKQSIVSKNGHFRQEVPVWDDLLLSAGYAEDLAESLPDVYKDA